MTTISEDNNYFTLKHKQFPVVPTFPLIIDELQGQTIMNNGLCLKTDYFNYRQLYMALSRVRNTNYLYVFTKNGTNKVKNVDFKELHMNINLQM